MTIPAKPPGGKCPKDSERESCPLECKYNFFESEDLTIHAWELKCSNCGWRDTIGFRSDEEEDDEEADPSACPFCDACDMKPGKNPCST
ncbi:MAG: hypothetical protein AAF456_24955 [Planctomycetota bacterium]